MSWLAPILADIGGPDAPPSWVGILILFAVAALLIGTVVGVAWWRGYLTGGPTAERPRSPADGQDPARRPPFWNADW